ncbi:phage tail tape measure protein [Escherichia coli]|uniref:phage tail tape measure protein n=1 Tax=Escherichia coli TaxID=562 RepID=UPI003A5216E6
MKQLDFTLSLIDKLSRPLKQAQGNVTGFAEKSKAAFMQIGGGAVALAGVGMAIRGALSPAIEMYDALNDAAAKGIDDSALKTVQRDALRFSTTYGASAVEFVKSTENINASIAGLTGNELPKVTKVANTLAFALKSTAADTAEFMGQMFGNFSADATRLGKVQFAEQLAGKMVYMRKTFGTEMATIKDLMEGARGVGTNYGVGLDEQLAVLGQLQRTLGTEASSAYEGFMTGAIDGAKKLGLSFTDSTGKMLSMPEMLIKLQGKYGKSLEGNLKAQAELDAAFGDSSAVVKHLYTDLLLRWFTGYVERSQPAENGFQRLFIRELVGVFERMWPCSFQHPTLREVASWLEENSGISVSVPDAQYSDTPIPHFTHNGTGYQLLNNLGRAFSIQDYIWYQLPDGSLYVGGAEKSLFAGRPVEIPSEFSQGAAGGNSVTLPVIQTMRPGVKATDKTTVLGTATLLAGAIQQVSAGDYSQAVKGNRLASIEGNEETDIAGQQSTKVGGAVAVEVGESLTEKIAALRKSVAAGGQQVMGATVHIGSESINALTMMLDTIDLLAELAQQCANHSHPTVGTPTNAAAFTLTATKAGQTRSKYQNIIA